MSEFIEVVEGFAINKDEIISVREVEENILLIQTENREYRVPASFRMFIDAMNDVDRRRQNLERMSQQFFAG